MHIHANLGNKWFQTCLLIIQKSLVLLLSSKQYFDFVFCYRLFFKRIMKIGFIESYINIAVVFLPSSIFPVLCDLPPAHRILSNIKEDLLHTLTWPVFCLTDQYLLSWLLQVKWPCFTFDACPATKAWV